MGPIANHLFWPTTWERTLLDPRGKVDCERFVAVMVHRIRAEEGSPDEVQRFVLLLGTGLNYEFMRPALPLIPELRDDK